MEDQVYKGKVAAHKRLHAQILLKADIGEWGENRTDGEISDALGISTRTVERVRRRLVEAGTVAFPVADTLMNEPTESEDQGELDLFCNTLIAIRREIAEIEAGQADAGNNLLRNAPHSQHLLLRIWF